MRFLCIVLLQAKVEELTEGFKVLTGNFRFCHRRPAKNCMGIEHVPWELCTMCISFVGSILRPERCMFD